MTLPITPLDSREREQLEENERVVAYGVSMFIAACYALRTIRDERLYREVSPTWAGYIAARWSDLFTDDSTANRWIQFADVQDKLTPIGVKLQRESHARAIAEHAPDIQAAVALVGVRAAELEGGQVTASHFQNAGAVIGEMVKTGAVDLDDGEQHPITEMLAATVVEQRREHVLQRIEEKGAAKALDARARVRQVGIEGERYALVILEFEAGALGLDVQTLRGHAFRVVMYRKEED